MNNNRSIFLWLACVFLFAAACLFVFIVRPAEAQTPTYSWYQNTGGRGYPSLLEGYVNMSEMTFNNKREGLYVIQGDAFVAPYPVQTLIQGSCFRQYDVEPMRFTAYVMVDDLPAIPLFRSNDAVVQFNLPVYGQVFRIRIETDAPLGCNVLFEAVE